MQSVMQIYVKQTTYKLQNSSSMLQTNATDSFFILQPTIIIFIVITRGKNYFNRSHVLHIVCTDPRPSYLVKAVWSDAWRSRSLVLHGKSLIRTKLGKNAFTQGDLTSLNSFLMSICFHKTSLLSILLFTTLMHILFLKLCIKNAYCNQSNAQVP